MKNLMLSTGVVCLITFVNAASANADCEYGGNSYSEGSAVCQAGSYMVCEGSSWTQRGSCNKFMPPTDIFENMRQEMTPILKKYGFKDADITAVELNLPVTVSKDNVIRPAMSATVSDDANPTAGLCFRCKNFFKDCKPCPSK